MEKKRLHIIDWLMTQGVLAVPAAEKQFDAWRHLFYRLAGKWTDPVDRAVIGGFSSDCIAFAFTAGYCSALQTLVPELPFEKITSLCVTEADGAHPRAIKSRLEPIKDDGGKEPAYTLTGEKKFITCANESEMIIAAASEGLDKDGKNRIRMVKVNSRAPGVTITAMEEVRLVPEISHGTVAFTNVAVKESDLLPGDGYLNYIKPFRTIEDLHVTAGILGYVFRIASRFGWDREVKQHILSLIITVRTLALSDPGAPEVHLVTGDVLNQATTLFELLDPLWESVDKKIRDAWNRDKTLMNIAQKARTRRLETAWAFYDNLDPDNTVL